MESDEQPTMSTETVDLVDAEYANVGDCVAWTTAAAPELGLRLAGRLWTFWLQRGMLAEGRRWLDQALRSAADEPTAPVRLL